MLARSRSTATGWPAPPRRADRRDGHRRPARPRGVPFRQSHGIVAGIVRETLASGRTLSELTATSLRGTATRSTTSSTPCSPASWLESKVSEGGTRSARAEQLAHARAELEGQPAARAPRCRRRSTTAPSSTSRASSWAACSRTGDRRAYRRDRGLPRVRAGLPRPRRETARTHVLFGPPGRPTSTAPTASTRWSTRSASPRASARRC